MAKPAPNLDIPGLNAVLKTALDAVVVMDTGGILRGWNDVAARVFGLTRDEVLGQRMSETIIPERHRHAHERGLAHFLATGEGPVLDRHIEIEAIGQGGEEIPIELSITFTDHFGEPLFLGFLRDISERRAAEATRQLLVDELNHRVKNLLGVVSGIAHMTVRSADSLEDFGSDFTGRLAALGQAHEILTSAGWRSGSLAELAAALTGSYAAVGDCISIEGPDLQLAPKDFLALSMILYELLTNAIKYGALSGPVGRLEIGWRVTDGRLALTWRELTEGGSAPPSRQGFGTRMIDFSARHDLNGSAHWDWTDRGLLFQLECHLR